jgi:signal transduction histidine kinase/ligand-binding sensor domain-containing protein
MPKTFWIGFTTCFWLVAGSLQLFASSNSHFSVETLDTEKGLPEMSVFSVAQTRDGYLWLGTGDGLARFDGLRFKRYEEGEDGRLGGSKIVRLFEDSQRNLWVGTDKEGVLLISPEGKVTSVVLGEPSKEGPVVTICQDVAGGIWLQMSKGQLYWYAQSKGHLIATNTRGLVAEDSGLVWLGSLDGRLFALGAISNSLPVAAFGVVHELPVGAVDFLLASKQGGYWRLANGHIQKWNRDQLVKDFGAYPWSLGVPVLTASEDREGNLVVGTFGDGVYWMDSPGKFTRVDGLPHSSIWSVLVDHEGSLWVGSNGGGLSRAQRQSFEVLDGTLGLATQSVCDDGAGGVWIGYNSSRIDHRSGGQVQRFSDFPAALQPNPGVTEFYARTVFQDRSGQVWAGGTSELSPHRSLFRLQNDRFEPVPGWDSIHSDVSAIYQDHAGLLWFGTQSGLARWDGKQWRLFTPRDGLSSDSVRALAEDKEGNLWIGTERGGLNRLRDGKFTVFRHEADKELPSDAVSSLYVDAEDVLWIGTYAGLARYDHGQWTQYTMREGLTRNKIGYIIEDSLGYLWLGSNAGLMRLLKKNLNAFARAHGTMETIPCRAFGKSDGLPRSECSSGSQPGACRTPDGKLCFPNIMGLVVLDPAHLRPNTNPPPVIVEGVRIDGVLQNPEMLRTTAQTNITVPARRESLEIIYTSLNLASPDKGLFRYLMENYETKWSERPGTIRYARYSRLPHGHYTFRVQACNEDGVWNETGASLAITVLPPFWQTWWFLTASTLCLLGLIVGSVHYVSTQKLQRQLAALRQQEALEKERARIARDLHDQLGANLTQVALLGELAESDKDEPAEVENHARQISQTARETTHALDEIVWTVNPSNDTLDGLINYVCKYAQDYLALAGLSYRLDVPPQLPNTPISPELRHNVFLAAKEAVNNVVKHAKATSVWLRLHLNAGSFVLEIEDNGRGIAKADEQKGRSGLRNMRKRLEDVGGLFETGPGGEGGTKVRLIVPMAGELPVT